MEQFTSSLASFLGKQGIIPKEDIDFCRYGLEIFITSFLEILSILLLSLLVGNTLETMLFFAAFMPLRIYAGGYHADARLRCYGILLVVYILFSVILTYLPNNLYLMFILAEALIALLIVFYLAPVSHHNKHLAEVEVAAYKKISRRIVVLQAAVILLWLCLFNSNTYLLAFSLGQLSVVFSMIAAIVKQKIKGDEKA